MIDANKSLVIDGTWANVPEDAVLTPLHQLLDESRRTPEIVVILRCKEKSTFDRIIDYDAI